jgi:hypothetical protein
MKKIFIVFIAFCSLIACAQVEYDRKEWKHWIDANQDCKDTRAEILVERSEVPVTYRSSKNNRECTVDEGRWRDYYFNEVLTQASQIDIDHLIPLSHAHHHGGAIWSASTKMQFANDPQNLVITNRSYNRQKGPKSIAQWLPIERSYACRYVKDWVLIKEKYGLPLLDDERQTISILNCPSAESSSQHSDH